MRSRAGVIFTEMLAVLIGLGLIATLIGGAYAGVRQRQRVEAASARLEEAQNICARWRAGATVATPGWTSEVRPAGDRAERLVLWGPGVNLSTLRPVKTAP